MDSLTEDDIRAFVENKDGSYPDLAELPTFWDGIGPDERDELFPEIPSRNIVLAQYLAYASSRLWAWDGLSRLHKDLWVRRDEIPEVLQNHVNDAYHGICKSPPSKGRPSKDDRDFRIMRVIRALREQGRTREQAIADVANATGIEEGTVESAVGKIERFSRTAAKRRRQKIAATTCQ